MQVGREAQVGETRAELPPDEAFCVIQTVDGRLARVLLANHAHLDGGIAKVRTELHFADGGHPDPGVLEVTDDDLADFLAQLCGDAFNSMSAHALIVWSVCAHPTSPSRAGEGGQGGGPREDERVTAGS